MHVHLSTSGNRFRSSAAVMVLSLMLCGISPWAGAAFPNKPIKLIVPYPPGGGGDTVARALGASLSETLGQPVIVDNKPGASGNIGSASVARSLADGHTLLLATDHQMAVNPSLFRNMGFDPIADLVPIGQVVRFPFVLVVAPQLPVVDLPSLIALMRKHPGAINNATVGAGSQPHLAGELLARQIKVQVTHIPYKGMTSAITDLVGGQVQMLFGTVSAVEPMISSGRLRAIAVSGTRRIALLPHVPTLAESGVSGFDITAWYGLYAPAGTPKPVIDRLAAVLEKAASNSEFVRKMQSQGLEPEFTQADDLRRLMAVDRMRWSKVIQEIGIQPE